jgi:hypothetical protein
VALFVLGEDDDGEGQRGLSNKQKKLVRDVILSGVWDEDLGL